MLDSEIKMFLSREMSDQPTNGGLMSYQEVISGGSQNVWPHVPKVDRDSGKDQYRKIHIANFNPDGESLLNSGFMYDGDTLGADRAFFFPVDHADTQLDWLTSPPTRMFVSGVLDVAVNAGESAFTVIFADPDQASEILNGDLVRVTSKTDPDSVSGYLDDVTVNSVPSLSGAKATCTIAGQFSNSHAAGTKVCVIYLPGYDVKPSVETITHDSVGGSLDDTQIVLGNKGTEKHTLTVSFTGTASFTVSSSDPTITGLPAGSKDSDYAAPNPNTSTNYIEIPAAAWSGVFLSGEEFQIPTDPARVPFAQYRRVPVGCPSLANNRIRQVAIGESPT